jgi:hypothetical protein
MMMMNDSDEAENGDDSQQQQQQQQNPDLEKLQAYRMEQQILLQLRGTMLSEAIAKRGIPIPTYKGVLTPEGQTPPAKVDWECAISTKEDPKECLFTFDAEVGSKVIAPLLPSSQLENQKNGGGGGSSSSSSNNNNVDGWVTLSALNRLRREDPSKVDGMWHQKYAILDSWFNPESKYSILQHVGPKGVLLNFLLNDAVLPLAVAAQLLFIVMLFMPVIEYMVNRFLVSGTLWMRWPSWGRFVHMGLPFKIMVAQWMWGLAAGLFKTIVARVKDRLVELECEILEETIPLTTGVPIPAEGEEILNEEEEEIMASLTVDEEEEEEEDFEEDEDDE